MVGFVKEIFTKIQKKYSQFEYIGGYSGSGGHLYLLCMDCGTAFPYNAQITRPAYKSAVRCPICKRVLTSMDKEEKTLQKMRDADVRKERKFAKRFHDKYGHAFEYVGGYKSNDIKAKIIIRCNQCGNTRERSRDKVFEPEANISCRECGANRRGTTMRRCDRCGNEYVCYSRQQTLCKECHAKEERIKKNIHSRLREAKARNNGAVDYSITLTKLIERDNGMCQLCGREVNEADYVYVNDAFVAGNDYPSIDHIKPLSKGGVHQWDNVQLAHRLCNSLKCDKCE